MPIHLNLIETGSNEWTWELVAHLPTGARPIAVDATPAKHRPRNKAQMVKELVAALQEIQNDNFEVFEITSTGRKRHAE